MNGLLREAYGLDAGALEPLTGGQTAQVWRCGPWVVKGYDLHRVDHHRVAGNLRLQQALADAGLPVPALCRTMAGGLWAEGDESIIALMAFVDGERKQRGTLTVAEAAALGALVARMHTALARLRPNGPVAPPRAEQMRRRWAEVAAAASAPGEAADDFDRQAADLAAYALDGLERLPAPDWSRQGGQLCHMDLHLDNILWRDSQPVAVLDFDNAAPGWPLAEVLTVWNLSLCADPGNPHWGPEADAFMQAYRHSGPVQDLVAWAEAPAAYWQMLMASTWPAGLRYRQPDAFRPQWGEALVMRAGAARWAEANRDRFAGA